MKTTHKIRSASFVAGIVSFCALATATPPATPPAPPPAPPATAPASPPATAPASPPATAPRDPSAPPAVRPAPNAPVTAPSGDVPERAFVVLETSKGAIVLELDGKNAPIGVENFLRYVDKGYYDDTIFHRVIGTFMIQGGGFDKDGVQKPTDAPIKNESSNGLKNAPGTIAYARTANPDSATSQFFINVGDNSALKDQAGVGYAVFGKVIAGMDAVDAIKSTKTGVRTLMARTGARNSPQQMRDVPVELIVIESAKQLTEDQAKARVAEIAKNAAAKPKSAPDGGGTTAPADGAPKPPTPPAKPPSPPAGTPAAPPSSPPR